MHVSAVSLHLYSKSADLTQLYTAGSAPDCCIWQGKSTLANFLLGRERSITGPEPGLTRDAVHGRLQFEERSIDLIDTAGWMRRNRLHNYDESG